MAKQQVGVPISPNDYVGLNQSVIPVKMVTRIPTTSDRKFRVGQVFIIGDSPSTGTEGDMYYLSQFDSSGDPVWKQLGTSDYASTTEPGIIEIATDAEAVAGSSGLLALVPSNIAPVLAEPPAIGGTTPAAVTGTTVTATAGVTGNVTGNLTGNVTGNVTGNLAGETVSATTSVTGGTVSATTAMTCDTLTASTSVSITGQTQHALPVFGASGLIGEAGPLTDGQLLIGNTGSAPSAATITAGTGISVTNGSGSIEIANLGGTPTNYYSSANPVYATAATYTVDSFFVRNSDDDGDISKDTSTTLDVSTTGLNGVAVSSALSGTISASGTAVTGTSTAFTTDFQVGDVIYSTTDSTGRRITVITDDTNLTVESSWTITGGASYRRGGEAPSTHYYVYAVTDGSTPGLLMSTRSVLSGDTLVDEPSGYTKSRQMKYIMTNNDDSDLFEQIWAGDRCAYIVQYRTRPTITGKTIIYASGSGSYVTVSAAEFVPKTSKCVYVDMHTDTASSARNIRLPGSTKTRYIEGDFHHPFVEIPLSSDQEFQIQVSITTGIAVNGYRITEFV